MNAEERKALCGAATIEGIPCTIGGYANDRASISGGFAGFWGADWETIKAKSGVLTADDVWLISSAWLGAGEEMPEKLWCKIPLKYRQEKNTEGFYRRRFTGDWITTNKP